jgi:hypothetical protein
MIFLKTSIVVPPKPKISWHIEGSRWISIRWYIDEDAYIQSFDLFMNQSKVATVGGSILWYNHTNLLPDRV